VDILGFEKILFHPEKLEKLKRGATQFPVNATVSLGNYCNHGCLWCTVYAARQEDVRQVNAEDLLTFLSRAKEKGLKSVAYIGNGEPTAFPGFGDLIKRVSDLGLEQGMFTNGYLLDRYFDDVLAGFTYVRVSLDAGSEAVHDKMHDVKGHFGRIMENIAELKRRREGPFPTIGIQYAVHHDNFDDLFRGAQASKESGADYFSVKPVYNRGSVGLKIEKNQLTDERLSPAVRAARDALEDGGYAIHYRPHQIANEMADVNQLRYDRCVAGFFNMQVYETGNVVSCGPGQVSVGTIFDDLDAIEARIMEVSQTLDLSTCPAGCRYHPLNHLVDAVLKPEGARQYHSDFI